MRGCFALVPGRSTCGSHQPHQPRNQTIMPLMEGIWLEGTEKMVTKCCWKKWACSCCYVCGKLASISKWFYPVSLQFHTYNTCNMYCLILFVAKNTPVSTTLIANEVNKAVRSFYISVLQLPQMTWASHRFVFHLTLRLNPRPIEFWLEGSEGPVPPLLKRHDSLCDRENIDMPRLLIVYASSSPTTESQTRQNKCKINVMQNFKLIFSICILAENAYI